MARTLLFGVQAPRGLCGLNGRSSALRASTQQPHSMSPTGPLRPRRVCAAPAERSPKGGSASDINRSPKAGASVSDIKPELCIVCVQAPRALCGLNGRSSALRASTQQPHSMSPTGPLRPRRVCAAPAERSPKGGSASDINRSPKAGASVSDIKPELCIVCVQAPRALCGRNGRPPALRTSTRQLHSIPPTGASATRRVCAAPAERSPKGDSASDIKGPPP